VPFQSSDLPWEAPDLLSAQRSMLVVYRGASPGSSISLDDAPVMVGRAPYNQIVLDDVSVAAEHFRVQRERDGWLLYDLGSPLGTFVDGERVKRAWLKPGVEIRAGAVTLRFTSQKERVRVKPSDSHRFGSLVGDSVVMREVFALLERIAPTEAALLVVGETGAGKATLARSVHARSRRASGPFVVVDCGDIGALPLESALFGHERGAFPGADRQHAGHLEAATGGTLFLREIDELPIDAQRKLLRALDDRFFHRIGSTSPSRFDARVIASSKKDLWREVQQGLFREDLFFRVSVFTVNLPPLRERREDIPALAAALAGEVWDGVPEDLREQLLAHGWPGNVSELRGALERAEHLSELPGGVESVLQRPAEPPPPPRVGPAPMGDSADGGLLPADYSLDFKAAKDLLLVAFEREYLSRLLARTSGNVAAAARLARVDRKHLSKLIRRHGMARRS
jgi:DNA-binding NtrC family response regulator